MTLDIKTFISAASIMSLAGGCGNTPPTESKPTATEVAPVASSVFTAPSPWNKDVSALPKSASSDSMISTLSSQGGWGKGQMRIDFGINVLTGDASTPFLNFTPNADFFSPDCDLVPFPVPPGGALEDETGYQCTEGGDCHLIVFYRPTRTLYEMHRADITNGVFSGGCVAVWSPERSYSPGLRGEHCTSTDAAGLPIAPLLFTADEVAAGVIDHAIRFILPNVLHRAYVHPATHAPSAGAGDPNTPPIGVRFRLRADYPLSTLTSGAQVVARAMQRYGMILADAGTIALTAANDAFTTHKWAEVGIDTRSLAAIQVTDMQVVDLGPTIPYTGDCVRNAPPKQLP